MKTVNGIQITDEQYEMLGMMDEIHYKHIQNCSNCTCEKPCEVAEAMISKEIKFRRKVGIPDYFTEEKN